MAAAETVAAVVLVGFDHRAGSQLEFEFPVGVVHDRDRRSIASLAIPDGCHRKAAESGFFCVRGTDSEPTLFGVSCVRQIASSAVEGAAADPTVTRNTVLKAVVVLMRVPAFGIALEQLDAAADALFDAKVLHEPKLFQDLYHSLCRSMPFSRRGWPSVDPLIAFHSLDARRLVLTLNTQLLMVVKAMLLGAKIMVHADPADRGCSAGSISMVVMALVSLLPGQLAEGLMVADHSDSPDCASSACCKRRRAGHSVVTAPCYTPGCQWPAVLSVTTLPLFLRGRCIPYASVPQLTQMTQQMTRGEGYICGTTNELLIRNGNSDVQVALSSNRRSVVSCGSAALAAAVAPTAADLRFIDDLVNTVTPAAPGTPTVNGQGPASWLGTSAWVRAQMQNYVERFMACDDYMQRNPEKLHRPVEDFGRAFFLRWEATSHCKVWRTMLEQIPGERRLCSHSADRRHPGAAEFSSRDLKLKLHHKSASAKEALASVAQRVKSGPAGEVMSSVAQGFQGFWSAFDSAAASASNSNVEE